MIQPTVSSVYIANSKNQEWSVEEQCEKQKVYGIWHRKNEISRTRTILEQDQKYQTMPKYKL